MKKYLLVLLLAIPAYAVDEDGNGIDDTFRLMDMANTVDGTYFDKLEQLQEDVYSPDAYDKLEAGIEAREEADSPYEY